jgi:peptide/nickel transport system substrate-binding protein
MKPQFVGCWRPPVLAALLFCFGVTPGRADSRTNVLTVGMTDEPFTLDPALGVSGTDYPYLYSLFDRLIDFEPKTLALRPGLATSWQFVGDDKLTLELTLRDGVQFQDGTKLDAEAVKASLEHFKSAGRIHDLDIVTSIEVVVPNKIRLHTSQRYSVLPTVLADRAGMVVSPTALAKYGRDFGRHPVGTGPFMLQSWTAGSTLEFARFPNYWDPSRIKLAGLRHRIIASSSSLVSALLSGQVDYAFRLDPKDAPALKASPKLRVELEPSTAYNEIALNTTIPPLDNVKVRQALNMSVDRAALAEGIMGLETSGGAAVLPVAPASWAYSKQVSDTVKYDPALAKALLTEAGFPDGITVKVCATPVTGYGTDVTDIEREQMKPAGITLDVTVMTGSACLQTFNSKRNFGGWQGSFSGRPDPFLTFQQQFGSTGQYNLGHAAYPGVDEALARILETFDPEKQKPFYVELNKAWVENVPNMVLYYRPNMAAYSVQLAGDQPNQQGKTNMTTLYFK